VSTRSVLEHSLDLRSAGFSIKIPDCSKSKKPFDYVLGIPYGDIMKFVAIEAKTATGWTLPVSAWQPHQRVALDIVSSRCQSCAWVIIGFLDLPKMKMDCSRKRIVSPYEKEVYLITWADYLYIEGERSCLYADVIKYYPRSGLVWGPSKSNRYAWRIPESHEFFSQKKSRPLEK